jgi:hypothetical protein
MPVGWAIVIVVQWLAIISLTVVVLGVLRQVTPHLEQAGERPLLRIQRQGPAVGSKLPALTGSGRNGDIITTALLRGRRNVLLFLSRGCTPCLRLARELSASDPAVELTDSLIVVADRADVSTLELPAWVRVLTVPDTECSEVLGVRGRPFAIAVDAGGVVKGKEMVNTVRQLTEFTTTALPPSVPVSVSPGDPA